MKGSPSLTDNHKSAKIIQVIWFAFFIGSLLVLILSIPGYIRGWPPLSGETTETSNHALSTFQVISSLASLLSAGLSLGLAAILFRQKRNDLMALFISFFLILYAIIMGGPLEAVIFIWDLSYSLAIAAQMLLMTIPMIVMLCTFPNGRLVPRWSRWLIVLAFLTSMVFIFIPIDEWSQYSNWYVQVPSLFLAACVILALYTQIYRYRYVSSVVEKKQTRWVVAGLFVWVLYMILASIPWTLEQNTPAGEPLPWWLPIARVSWWLSLSILPLSLTIAVLKSNLFDIDLLIRRTLVYTTLTGMLALVFFGSIVILQAMVSAIGVQQNDIATVISTLGIAALFNPLRIRVQDFIDRRFYRMKYDAEQALVQFAQSARDEVDADNVAGALLGVVIQTMKPREASLWMKDPTTRERG